MGVGSFGASNFANTSTGIASGVVAVVESGVSAGLDVGGSGEYCALGSVLPDRWFDSRQTYDSPAIPATAAGDPVGLLLPTQADTQIVNNLIWTDSFSLSPWSGNATVTGNTRNDSGVGNPDGPSPVADTLAYASSTTDARTQAFTCDADSLYKTASIDLEANTATNSLLSLLFSGGNVYSASIAWSGGVPTVTAADSATADDVGATLQANGIYKVWVRGANDGRTSGFFRFRPSTTGAGNVYASRAQLNNGPEVLEYQPNAGCLGGSNRRGGGANQVTWSQDVANPAWTKTSTSAADDGTITATAALAAHRLQNPAIATVASTQYTAWFDVVRTNHDFFQIFVNSTAGAGYVNFNINALTKSESTATGTVTDNGDGSVRISITYTSGAVTTDYPVLCFITSLAAARGENWTPVGTETVRVVRAFRGFGSSVGTYTRNMDMLGGLLRVLVFYQDTTANRATLAAVPVTQIRQLFVNPRQINGASWTRNSCTVTDGVVSYDGTLTASLVVSGSSGGISGILQNPASPSVEKTHSYVLKAGAGTTWVRIAGIAAATNNAWLNLITGTVGIVEASVTATITPHPLGGGWYICSMTAVGTTNAVLRFADANGSNAAVLGQELYVADPQMEFGASRTTWQNNINNTLITEPGVPYMYAYWYDRVTDSLTSGVQGFGTTSLMAKAGQQFTVFWVVRTVNTSSVLFSKGSTLALRTSSGSTFQLETRGTQSGIGGNFAAGNFNVICARWDGTTMNSWLNRAAKDTRVVGSGTESSSNILIPSTFGGYMVHALFPTALSDTQVQATMYQLCSIYRAGLP